ncbi:MAG: DUF4292 domain-containing protein [Flavobacteriales bacterium]|nr:DUF4292 domain-containing protein [Flavobacteriales bacterium]
MIAALFLIACKSKKDTVKKDPLRNRTAGFLLRHYEENKFDFEWAGMKVDAEYMVMGETQGFKATIRMKKDSAVWISITPALGIEMIRMLVTPDSLKYLSKIPENKFYYLGTFEDINKLIGVGLDFDMLQDILVGNAIGLEKDEGRFRSETENESYLLISKYKRRVRRVVGVDDRRLEDDTIVVNPNDPRYQRTLKRVDEEDGMIISRYWVEPEHFRLIKSVFNDLIKQRTMELHYSEFQLNEDQIYPSQCRLILNNPSAQQELNFEITKISTGKPYDFPFEIPEDYIRKDSL